MLVNISYNDFLVTIECYGYFPEYTVTLKHSEKISDNKCKIDKSITYQRESTHINEEKVTIETYEKFHKYLFCESRKDFLTKSFKFINHELLYSNLDVLHLIKAIREYSEFIDQFAVEVSDDSLCLFAILEKLELDSSVDSYLVRSIRNSLKIFEVTGTDVFHSNIYNFEDFYPVIRDCIREYTVFDNKYAMNSDYILTEYLKNISITPDNYVSVLEVIYRFNRFIGSNESFVKFVESEDFDEIFHEYSDRISVIKKELLDYAYDNYSKNLYGCFDSFKL